MHEHDPGVIPTIERGVADAQAGRLVSQDEAMGRLKATIAAVEQKALKRRGSAHRPPG